MVDGRGNDEQQNLFTKRKRFFLFEETLLQIKRTVQTEYAWCMAKNLLHWLYTAMLFFLEQEGITPGDKNFERFRFYGW